VAVKHLKPGHPIDPAPTAGDPAPAPWHTVGPAAVAERLAVDPSRGLDTREATRRLAATDPNELVEKGGKSPLRILLEQFTSLMVLLLLGAAAVSGLVLQEWEDALVILVIVLLNAVLGFSQEYRAQRALAALKSLAQPLVRVRRDGQEQQIASRDLVPGDIVVVEAGNLVPADCRIIEAAALRAQEAALTGEAEAVEKSPVAVAQADAPLGDRRSLLFMGTTVSYGRGIGVVTATGMGTELGRIAHLLQSTPPERTVLQGKLQRLSLVLVFAALTLIGAVILEGWLLRGLGIEELFLTAVSMAVAAIPEGLPAVVTIALALGARRMLRRRALIRRLPAVETLGSVTVICSDKTGTLTQNRMTVKVLELPYRHIELREEESPGAGAASGAMMASNLVAAESGAWILLAGGALCSDAALRRENGAITALGDPTEGALVVAAARQGWDKVELEALLPRTGELPFDSQRKRMSTMHALPSGASGASGAAVPAPLAAWLAAQGARSISFTKGAADGLLEISDRVWLGDRAEPLGQARREHLRAANERLAAAGVRVLGVAFKPHGEAAAGRSTNGNGEVAGAGAALEQGLVFAGLAGMLDPLRPEAVQAVQTCRRAGIRVVMITGDHPLIARTIGEKLGLGGADQALTGRELERLGAEELRGRVEEVSVYARVSPEHKLKIVDALQGRGHIVAMTGDGVNDAPALKSADIGVAMGITGTDVAKEAADMVLQDDNFATIVAAVEEGRIIFDNILRFVRYILASNWAEILVMLVAPLLGMPLPLYPVQILWMNLVTDGLPALALGVEPGEAGVMRRPPRHPKQAILSAATGAHILWVGLVMTAFCLGIGAWAYGLFSAGRGVALIAVGTYGVAGATYGWRTMLFTTLVFSQLTLALGERSSRRSVFRVPLASNPYLLGSVALTLGLQLAVVYLPLLQGFFRTTALSLPQLGACLACSLGVLAAVEVEKLLLRGIRAARQRA
jgi:Ca2+-transporting ATPase